MQDQHTEGAGEGAADRLPPRTTALVAVVATAAFMAVLDGTVVSVALDTFTTTFDASVSVVGWVTVGYLLAAAVSLPVSGWAVERFGGRRVFFAGLGLFVLGSLLSSLAWSVGSLIAFRVVQGLGGGALEPTALVLAARNAPAQRVGAVMGFLSLVINVAPVLGPLLGGALVDGGHWRWIFLLNLPAGIAVALAAWHLVPDDPGDPDAERSDLPGLGLLSPGFALVLLAIERIGAEAGTAAVVVPGLLGLGLLTAYARRSRRVERPVLDLGLFSHRAYATSVGVMAIVGVLMYSQLVAYPIYAARAHDLHGTARGVLVTALGVGLMASMALSSRRSDVVGPRRLVRPGAAVMAIGLVALAATMGSDPSLPLQLAVLVVVGLGLGSVAAPTFSSVYRTLPAAKASQGTTGMFIVLQTAASLGVTVFGLLLARGGDDAFRPLVVGLAVLAASVTVIGRLLPGPAVDDEGPALAGAGAEPSPEAIPAAID